MELTKVKIRSIKKMDTPRQVYDLTVQGNHNFFIGENRVLTHNCDYLSREAQPALRNLMEAYSEKTRFILTANYIERIIDPLVSRTQVYRLEPPSKKEVAKKLAHILTEENVEYDVKTIAQIVNAYYPDIRKCINTTQLQTQDGVLQISTEELIGQDVRLNIIDTLTDTSLNLKQQVNKIRQIVADNEIQDFTEIYQVLYEHVDVYAPNNVPGVVIAISEGMFRDGQVPDKEINFSATLYNILTLG